MSMMVQIAPEFRPWLAERIEKRLANRLALDVVETEMVRKNGSRYTALVAPATLYDTEGKVSGLFGVMIEITGRNQASSLPKIRLRLWRWERKSERCEKTSPSWEN
ncbi:MAG: PAS domain S-box protein [Proteobacteria bacterium]|nr:PAS domain S-box protein [Pseudomonadota bacterium]